MKRNKTMLGFAITAGLCMGVSLGCADENLREYRRPQEAKRMPTSAAGRSSANAATGGDVRIHIDLPQGQGMPAPQGAEMAQGIAITPEMKKCDPNNKGHQCTFIPRETCFGCLKEGDGWVALNLEAANKLKDSFGKKCQAELQNFKPAQGFKGSSDPTCRMDNKPVCLPEGVCGIGKMTQAEMQQMQQMMEKMQKAQGGQGGQGGQGQGMPPA